MNQLKSVFLMLLLISFGSRSFGQRYNFEQYDIEDGLIQSQVTSMAQDGQNRLWIATLGGLSCFNGNQFSNLGKTNGLNSNFILSLTNNKQGNLLIGTEKGLSIYKHGNLHKYTRLKEWADALTITESGTVYGISGRHLFKIDGMTTKQVYITGDTTEIVTALMRDEKKILWAAVYRQGLYYLEGDRWLKKDLGKSIENLVVTNLLNDNFAKDKIWLVTPSGIFIAGSGETKQAFNNIKKPISIAQDEKGNIWVGTKKGAWYISGARQIHFNAKNGFTDNVVNQIYRDRENNIWLGTDGSGVFKFNSKTYVTYDESQGLQNSIVMSIIKGPDPDAIWMGTYDGIFEHKNNTIRRIPISADQDDAKRISFLFKDSGGSIWVSTVGAGLWIYKNGVFKRVDGGNPALACNSILEDRHKNIWISTNFGCFVLNNGSETTTQASKQFVTSLLEIGDNIMVMGGQNGATIIRNKKEATPLKFKPVAGSNILSMLKCGEHVLFGTADNGLIIWNFSTGKVKQLNTSNGLFSDHIYSLLLDDKGIIWMGTGRGVNKLRSKDFSLLSSDNTVLIECNQHAIFKNRDQIWIGTTKGVLVYKNKHESAAVSKPFIFINSVYILAQNKSGGQSAPQITYKEHELTKKITLPYNHNHLNINFTGIYLSNPKAVLYQYQLEGLDDKYSKPNVNSSVNYTALPPGKYKFQVKAVTASGVASGNTAFFELEITPPYYQTTVFRVFIIIIILLFIMISVYVIINLNERQRKLRLKIKLEEQFKIRKQTAEDFHDDLGNKLTRISVLSEVLSSMTSDNEHEKRAIIDKIKTNVNELYNGTKDILWSLNPKNDTVEELLTHIKEFGFEMFNDTNVLFKEVTLTDDAKKRLSLEVSRNILMIFKEAINNALKYSKATQVTFTGIMRDNVLQVKLQDNGVGFDTSSVKNGHGINNMRVRTTRIKGNLSIKSNAEGTTVTLSVKT